MKRIVLLASLFLSLIGKSFSQNVFDPADPMIRYSSSAAYGSAQRPDTTKAGLQKYVSVPSNGISTGTGSFDPSSYKAYFMNYYNTKLPFRLKFPKSFTNPDSASKKYPMMLFMHGAGEAGCNSNGAIYNNEQQLTHGGSIFNAKSDNGEFDAFLVYPQLNSPTGGCWGEWGSQMNYYNTVITIIDSIIKYARGDIDRLYVFGLSAGGVATWKLAEQFPQRVTYIAPTSAAGLLLNYPAFVHIPIWLATGGKDTNPSPTMAQYSENQVTSIGGNLRRTLYPTLGHASWYAHWAEPDFIPYMFGMHKANPLIFFNRSQFCPDSAINTKLGLTPGFYAYEWQKDGVTIATRTNTTNTIIDNSSIISFTGNEITVKSFGTYRARFQRTATAAWSIWSPTPAVISPKPVTQTPPITVVGLKSSVLPSLDGKTSVQLQMPAGFINYQWYRSTDNTLVSTNQIYDAPAGSYKARYSEPYGCGTLFSPVFKVVAASGTPKPDAAKNLSVTAISQKTLRLDWSDNPNAGTNETGFEIYRGTKSGGPYTLINITAQNVVTYSDTTLTPNMKYFYVVRSVASTGAGPNSNEASGTTQVDNVPPTAPTNLEYRGSNIGTVFLRWGAATDDVALSRYDIYVNGVKTYSTTDLFFPVANLDSLTSFTFVVKAVDKAGNVSAASNQVLGYTHHQGLHYKYYQGSYSNLPDFNSLTPVKQGITDTVNAGDGIRTQDDNFAFLWEGSIYIPVSGYYTFETNSDDGSMMFLDTSYGYQVPPFINNDGAHGATTKTATKYLVQGYHSLAYTFAEVGGDQVMDIYWSSSVGLARERVPKNFLSQDFYSGVSSLASPSSLVATSAGYNKVKLRWKDNSVNETGFEIVRSTSMTGTFNPVYTVGANVTSYTDSSLTPNTTYYYKVRSINANGVSAYEFAYPEAIWDFNNSYADSTGVSANALTGTNTSFTNSDKVEGTHSVTIANSGYLSFNTGTGGFPALGGYSQRSVSLWIKPTSTSGKRMIFDFGGSDNGMGMRINSSALIGGIASASSRTAVTLNNFTSDPNWLSGQWNHVALVYDVNSLTLYLNGTAVASTNALTFTSVANSTNASRIGNNNSNNVFNDNSSYSTFQGGIDNMYVIRGALSKSEIDSIRSFVFMPSNAKTTTAPSKPNAPSGLTAQALSTDSILLQWNDNSTDETGFQIFRSSGDKSNNRLIATVPAANGGQVSFLDSALFANVTYYYRVRATGLTTPSDSTAEVSAKTLNTFPEIKQIRGFTMKYGTTYVLPVTATDVDGDPLSFTTANLPSFATLQNPSNGVLNVSFSPSIAKKGSYPISIYVSDGNGGKDTTTFTLVVNNNDVPVLTATPAATDTTINEGGQYVLNLSGTDGNGTAQMIWSFDGLPAFGTFVNNNNGTGVLTFKPTYSNSGVYSITITLNDGYGAWTSRTLNLTVLDKEPNETVQFNFRSTSTPVPTWNNVNVVSPSFSHSTIYDIKGNVSSMALSLISGSVSPSTIGPLTGNNSGPYPDQVIKDMMTWSFNTNTNATDTIQVKVSGLDAGKSYNFMFQAGYNINALVTFKIGVASVTRNAYLNATGIDTLKNIMPNALGEVVITMIGDPSTTRGGVLNAMVVKANYDDGSTPAKPLNLAGVHLPNTGVSLTWQDRAYNETGYYVFRAAAKAGPYTLLNNGATNKDSSSFIDPAVSPQATYYYYVVGINAAGFGTSSDTIKVATGNNAPVITASAGIYVKSSASVTSDFSATDDPGDVVSVQLTNPPSFVSLQSLGGSNYRITASPGTDHIGWYTVVVTATDDKGASSTKNIILGVADKNTRSVFINFGNTTVAPAPWNNWLGAKGSGAALTAMKDEANVTTPFTVTNNLAWGGLNDLGHVTGNNSGVYPDSVMASGLMDVTGPKSFTITGLNNAMKYNLVFVGSMNEGGNNLVEYASGTTKDTLNSKYNTNQTGNLNGLVPANGSVTVTLTRVGSSSVNYLNAMVIEEYDPNAVAILNPLNLYAEPVDRNNVDLSWSDRTADEDVFSGYVLERASDSLFTQNFVSINLPANTSTYRFAGLNPNTKYWFRVKAMATGGVYSDYSNRTRVITPASIVYVNFNYTMPNAPAPWNNTYSAPSFEGTQFTNLTNQAGVVSGLTLTLTKIFNGEFTAGMITGNNSGPVPDAVLAGDYWQDNTQLSEFRVSGLNQSRHYRVGFLGSSGPNGWFKGNYTATYTVNGRTVYLNSWLNNSKVVYIGDIVPGDDGSVLLDFSTTVAAQYGFHAGIIIEDYTDPVGGSQQNLVLSNPSALANALGRDASTNSQIAAAAASAKTRMYPNPFIDFVNMDFNNNSANNNVSVDVYDLSGRITYHRNYGKLPAGSNTLSVNGNEAGMITGVYIVTLNVNGKPVQANKVVRTRN